LKQLLAGAAIALAAMTGTRLADGQANDTERPIMMMVSYGAGGASDLQSRIVTRPARNEDAL